MKSSNEDSKAVVIDYTNYRGERAIRNILPLRIDFGTNQWHKQCWYLTAVDLDKNLVRTFAIKDIHSWEETKGGHQVEYID